MRLRNSQEFRVKFKYRYKDKKKQWVSMDKVSDAKKPVENEKMKLKELEKKIIEAIKTRKELDFEEIAKNAPDDIRQILENFQENVEKIATNLEGYPEALSLLCLHSYAQKGERFSDFPPKIQKNILLNAAQASHRASLIANSLNESELEALYIGMAGNALYRLHEYREAEKAYINALEIYKDLKGEGLEKHKLGMAIILDDLGNLYNDTGKLSQAEVSHIEALETIRDLAEKNPGTYERYMAKILNNLGDFYRNAGKFSEAENAYTEALKIKKDPLEKEKNPEIDESVASTLNSLGLLHFETGNSQKAKKEYDEALNIYRNLAKQNTDKYVHNVAGCFVNIGNLHMKRKEFCQAQKFYTRALKEYRKLEKRNPDAYTFQVATSLNNLGVLYSDTERPNQAKKVYEKALEKYKEAAQWFDAARTCYNLSKIKSDKETLENARRLLESGILFSEEEKYKYAQKGARESIYLSLLEKNVSVFGILEALRDPQLLSLPWGSIFIGEKLEKARKDIGSQKELVKVALSKGDVLHYKPKTLPENLLFIYVQKIGDLVYFFALDNSGIRRFKCREFFQKGLRSFEHIIEQMKGKEGVEEFEIFFKEWYEILPKEIDALIQEKDCIVFSPDHYCSILPLEGLQMNEQPLCLEKTLVRAISLRQFLFSLRKEPNFDSSLIIGNPWLKCSQRELFYCLPGKIEEFSISFLKGAEAEARNLSKCLPNHKLLLRNRATGEKFLSEIQKRSIIHFSGHGHLGRVLLLCGPLGRLLPPFEPEEFSKLRKYERTEGTKKINMMEEWYPVTDLDLRDVRLIDGAIVFLDACETGLHEYKGGGYYQGLSAAFLKNGAHSVISSLIPLFDEQSKEFADEFYRNLLASECVSQSLKKARKWAKDKKKAPQIYWIPYLHYGSPF